MVNDGSPGRIRTYNLEVTCDLYVSIGHGLSHHLKRNRMKVAGALGCTHLVSEPSSKGGLAADCLT